MARKYRTKINRESQNLLTKRQYKENRVSTKGKSKWEIYQAQRERFKAKGYILDEGTSKEHFEAIYNQKKKMSPDNVIRRIVYDDIVMTKSKEKKIIKEIKEYRSLDTGYDAYDDAFTFFDPFLTDDEEHLDFDNMSKKEIYDFYRDAYDAGYDWAEGYAELFYRGSVFY